MASNLVIEDTENIFVNEVASLLCIDLKKTNKEGEKHLLESFLDIKNDENAESIRAEINVWKHKKEVPTPLDIQEKLDGDKTSFATRFINLFKNK